MCTVFLANVRAVLPHDGQETEYRFAMGKMPDEMRELCVRLFKLTDTLRALVEYMLNDLSEKPASMMWCGSITRC